MPFRVDRYCCDFCKRFVRSSKERVVKHEPTCFSNPLRKSCRTCKEECWQDERRCSKGLLINTSGEKYKDIGIRWDCEGWEKIENYG